MERTTPLQGVQLKNSEMEIAIECCVRRGALVPGCSKSFNSVLSYPLHTVIIISLPQTSQLSGLGNQRQMASIMANFKTSGMRIFDRT